MSVFTTTLGQDYQFINYNATANEVNWFTNDYQDIGVFTI